MLSKRHEQRCSWIANALSSKGQEEKKKSSKTTESVRLFVDQKCSQFKKKKKKKKICTKNVNPLTCVGTTPG